MMKNGWYVSGETRREARLRVKQCAASGGRYLHRLERLEYNARINARQCHDCDGIHTRIRAELDSHLLTRLKLIFRDVLWQAQEDGRK